MRAGTFLSECVGTTLDKRGNLPCPFSEEATKISINQDWTTGKYQWLLFILELGGGTGCISAGKMAVD